MIDTLINELQRERQEAQAKVADGRYGMERELAELVADADDRADVPDATWKRIRKLLTALDMTPEDLSSLAFDVRTWQTLAPAASLVEERDALRAACETELSEHRGETSRELARRKSEMRLGVTAAQNPWGAGRVDECQRGMQQYEVTRAAEAAEIESRRTAAARAVSDARTARAALAALAEKRPAMAEALKAREGELVA